MSDLTFTSRRSPVMGTRGMVATTQPLASAAGIEMLVAGGNAADAAVAAAAALNVTEPTSTGLGGDCFALFFASKSKQITALNGSGRAPRALTIERLRNEGIQKDIPQFHAYTITVPGACAGWVDLIDRHGSLDLPTILSPAIRLAQEGFPVSPITAHYWARGVERQLKKALGGLELTISGRAPRSGEIFRNPGLARTLKTIAAGGKAAFYEGEIGSAIVNVIRKAGGCLDEIDLAMHASTWPEPISSVYRNLRVYECPPNGQGLTALIALNILKGFDLAKHPPLSAQRLHLVIEALRLAFADTRWYVADPEIHPAPLVMLLSQEYAEQRRRLINPEKASLDQVHGTPHGSSDTVYLSVVDGQGNACSFINSNYMGFGTGIIPEGWGFTLQNRGHNFELDPDHPNALSPGKRPYHTIIPGMATRVDDESLYASFGVMGGFMQPQGHVQIITALHDDGLDPQAALDHPRFCILDGRSNGEIALEEGIAEAEMEKLARMGHSVKPVSGHKRAVFGRGQIITRKGDDGLLIAGSDPRADGCAMTY